MQTEKIGNVRFYPSTYSPEPGEADVAFSSDCDTGEYLLTINLGTKDDALAIERGRRIVRLWQLSEDMVTDGQLAAMFQHAEFASAWLNVKIAFGDEVLKILRAITAAVEDFVGRRRGPDPDLQPGRVSLPTQDDKQGKCQE